MSGSLKVRIEKAFREHYLGDFDIAGNDIAQIQMLVSRDQETNVLPRIHILVTAMAKTEGFQGSSVGEFEAEMSIALETSQDDMTAEANDALFDDLQGLLVQTSDLLAALNEADGLHFYLAEVTGTVEEVQERTTINAVTLRVLVAEIYE